MLYDTYGFPFEITQEIAAEKNITIDKDGYEKLMMNQKEIEIKAFTDKVSSSLNMTHSTEFIGYEKQYRNNSSRYIRMMKKLKYIRH